MARILSPEMQMLEKRNPMYNAAANKVWDYKFEDFEIIPHQELGYVVKHKTWNTAITNDVQSMTYNEAVEFIHAYINNTTKPIIERINFKFHLV